ncbi:MAG TPA: YebC/PmpR family DNA-binding transcriptional regulator [Candidatus Limnocylindria bacterium]|nr:YebC/PmpR family DNA-binding transcriptional regulator [Candidatus Limnocylindria bacterium]
MSGHSKWSTIKHKKAKEDAKRGKVFTKLIKEITVAARSGGDPAGNPRLRLLMDKAKEVNMPQDNMTRAIKKGTGELPGVSYEECMYEGYGPNGIAVIVDTLTDNKNRMAAEMRRLFTTHGGSLGETGSVGWMFEKLGVVRAEGTGINEDDLLEKLIDYDVKDIQTGEGWVAVFCDAKSLEKVKQTLAGTGLKIESAQLEWVAKSTTALPTDKSEKAYEFLSELDDHDDVRSVYTNLA